MKTRITTHIKQIYTLFYLLGVTSLIVGLLLTTVHLPVKAAGLEEEPTPTDADVQVTELPTEGPACTPPNDFDRTVRLKGYGTGPFTKEWNFEIEEPEMDVVLEFFYYQDHDKYGCPFDCSTGACQDNEIGTGESPLGAFEITDGSFGANSGSVRLRGRLSQGTYHASFKAGGSSMNIGLKVHRRSLPTETPVPPPTATALPPTPTETSALPTATEVIFPPVATATDTPGGPTEPSPTTTPTEAPTEAPTETATPMQATPTGSGIPPSGAVTATPTSTGLVEPPVKTRTPRPPATLPPPAAPTLGANPPALIPVTGADLAAGSLQARLFLKLGIALLGLGVLLHGLGRQG